jgi:tetratricopeptide (TPR) repeat protein
VPSRSASPSIPIRGSESTPSERENALSEALKLGQLERAAHLARSLGSPRYAARLFAEARLPYQAAVCSYEAGEPDESLESFLKVSKGDARYRRACVQAIRISTELGLLTTTLDRFVDEFLGVAPGNEMEAQAFYRLGILYQQNELFDHAREAFALVLAFESPYADAAQRLAIIEPVLRNEALYRGMIRQDADDWRKPARAPSSPSSVQTGSSTEPTSTTSETLLGSVSSSSLALPSPPSRAVSGELQGVIGLGSVLADRYRIDEEIGQGGMGLVYRAFDLELDEAVAIKIFGQRLDDPNLVSRFKQELSICRSLSHPNVIRHHDIGAHEGRKFISMELLAGSTLRLPRESNSPSGSRSACLRRRLQAWGRLTPKASFTATSRPTTCS